MIAETVVELSRWQFAITAMLHFLFIPLTLGLVLLLALLESVYVFTGKVLYKTVAQFWGQVFAINFVLAVATRLLVLFQFGMNGSYFSHYAGDVFILPLVLEAFTSFFLATVLFGFYQFGWDRLNRRQHVLITWLMAFAINLSAYWILLANGWMQNPVAATFNYQSYRMELTDLTQLLSNPAALAKYWHTTAASYATAAATIMGISAFRLRNQSADSAALVSFKWASMIGLLSIALTLWSGDATVLLNNPVQQAKRAAFTGVAIDTVLPDIETRVRSGMAAYDLLQQLRDDDKNPQLVAAFNDLKTDLGYALLLTPVHKQILGASDQQIKLAAQSALPANPDLLYWGYRVMVVLGMVTCFWFFLAAFFALKNKVLPAWFICASLYLAAMPWMASVTGWLLAELGKQPWVIAGVLPAFLGVSSLSVKELVISSLAYAATYGALLVVGLYLLRRVISGRTVFLGGV